MTELQTVIDTLDNAADSFDGIATKEQKKIYDEVILLAKDLDTDASGKVKQSIANLKRLTQIKAHLAALSKDKEWVAGISQFAKYFGILQQQQNAYFADHFPELTLSETAKKKHELQKQIAVQNTMETLIGSGLKANVTDKLNEILLRAVTSGAKFADLQEELRVHLLGKDGGQGAFARYATTYATTALSQFTGQNNKLLTDDLDTEWFMYVGSNKETTRPFCEACTRKKYIHRSEIHTLLTGHIHIAGSDDVNVPIYAKTGLPYGMIEGTNEENFQINVGGWNCRHQLVPVADAVVPKNIREEIEKIHAARKQADELRKSGDYKDIQTNSRGGLKAIHKGHIVHSAHREQTFFEDNLTSTQLELACQNQLYRQGHRAILRDESAQDNNGNKLPALDLELDGKIMDIASVTKGTCGSALLNKNKQANRCLQELGVNCDTICLYYHDSSMFSEERLKKNIEWYYEHVTAYHHIAKLKKIIVVIKGDSDILEYDI